MTSPTVPILVIGLPSADGLAALRARFVVHHVPHQAEADAVVAAHGATIRGVATNGAAGIGAALIGRLPALEIIAHFGVGYDPVDVAAAAARGIVVTNTPDVLTEEVADVALALILMTARELPAAEGWLRAGRWASEGPYPPSRGSLRGRHVGILGYGRIGQAIARRVEAFGLPVAYHSRSPVAGATHPYHPSAVDLAAAVDTLIVATPGNPQTRHLVNAAVLAALGPDGIVVNIGRGVTIDEAALVEALAAGTILGAGLDVFEDEPRPHPGLLDLPRVVLLPHIGSASVRTRGAMGQLQLDNLAAWFAGKPPVTPVPETPSPR